MKKRKGFTLIELLIVIAIIVILIAILMPSLRKARNQARNIVCQSNLKQWGLLFAMYIDSDQGRFADFPGGGHYSALEDLYVQMNYEKLKIRFCPMASKISNITYTDNFLRGMEGGPFEGTAFRPFNEGFIGSAFKAWEYKMDQNWHNGSYGINDVFVSGFLIKVNPTIEGRIPHQGADTYSMKKQSNIPVYLDSASPFSIFIWEGERPAPKEEEDTNCCINRHDGGVNSVFLDGSVRKVGLKELWKLKWHKDFNTNGPWTIAGGVKSEDWPEWMRGFKDY